MSFFVLDLDRLRHTQASLALVDVANGFSETYGDHVRWRVCPECLWLTVSYDPALTCRRRPQDPVSYGGRFDASGSSYECKNQPLQRMPDDLSDALWGALRVGGVNAVVEIVAALKPEDAGLLSSLAKARQRGQLSGR